MDASLYSDARKSSSWGWAVAFAATLLLVGLATVPPLLDPTGQAVLMQAFAPFCHQIPARSPHLHGVALAVCHRCYGIYVGLCVGVVLYGVLRSWRGQIERHLRYLIALSLLPLGLDWLADAVDFWTNTPASRLLTGGVFGVVAGALLARALMRVSAGPHRTSAAAPPGS